MKRLFCRCLFVSLFLFIASFPVFAAESVDINRATASELAAVLTGVGPEKARTIVEYRESNGAFKQADELLQVKGVGPRLLELNRSRIVIDNGQEP